MKETGGRAVRRHTQRPPLTPFEITPHTFLLSPLLFQVSQLRDIFTVRWSVFLLGPPGAGKTAVWRVLARALTDLGEPTDCVVINPKVREGKRRERENGRRVEGWGCRTRAPAP